MYLVSGWRETHIRPINTAAHRTLIPKTCPGVNFGIV
jgi:hypothetical protein